MDIERTGVRILSRQECLGLLSTVSVGRVGVHAQALPIVLPVAFAVEGDSIVVNVGEGTQLHRASRDRVVAFEADDLDAATGAAWSVSVTGMATEITDPGELARARGLKMEPWGGEGGDHYVRISLPFLTGRRTTVPAVSRVG